MTGNTLLTLASIGAAGIACQWLAWFTRLPAILFLLIIGIVMGPVSGYIDPDALFGDLLFPFISLSVAIILFEGSMTLKFSELRGLARVVRNLITVGAAVTWVISALAAYYLLDFSVGLAALFGAIVIVTGPTVIVPMLRSVRPNAKIANVLRWEGIAIDPLGALLAVLVYNYILSGQGADAFGSVMLTFLKTVGIGTVVGMLSAMATAFVLRHHLVPEYLRNMFVLALVIGAFSVSDLLQHESGLLAVTVMGMALANTRNLDIEDILNFKETLSLLLISALFIILAARVELHQFAVIGWPALGVLAVIMFIARPLGVALSAWGSDLNWRERSLIAWIGPRGIVAAAVAAVFALRLEEVGYDGAAFIIPLTFTVIIGTVIIQSATAAPLAKLLKVAEPEPRGFLIVGAGNVARVIGKALQERDFKIMLSDSNWENVRSARMEGLPVYYGNPISDHADRHMDLVGIGRLLAMSGRANFDALAIMRFRREFEPNHLYQLLTSREQRVDDKHNIADKHRGQPLFGEDVTHAMLASWIRAGAELRTTSLTDSFDFDAYLDEYRDRCIPLFAVDEKNVLHVFTSADTVEPESGWDIMGLIAPKDAGLSYSPKRPEEAAEEEKPLAETLPAIDDQ
ncbi:CPA1 family monovalent cation:H+ antiporter [Methylohalomonas lacus]|uniref:CPA1 family monovalent cation:H+ antiporter n=1 Tax=Methylohalomonas lacus TaxID=398773 RepID=A0AAE3HMV8_9GAMM|nr:sodium:proton antiporter [Methylohalomonas lacus]MCS3904278.1 CPA1 family monovalent cation:H+ antiporter [Methylohalomonas lacus]